MNIRIRKNNADGLVRLETSGPIVEVMINEDILHPDKESIALCFRGKNSSGIIEITPAEFDKLYQQLRGRLHLIRGLKRLTGGGAVSF